MKASEAQFFSGEPFSMRSMSRFELRLRHLAGSGLSGEHPTGYRWAQRLCDFLDRRWWQP